MFLYQLPLMAVCSERQDTCGCKPNDNSEHNLQSALLQSASIESLYVPEELVNTKTKLNGLKLVTKSKWMLMLLCVCWMCKIKGTLSI